MFQLMGRKFWVAVLLFGTRNYSFLRRFLYVNEPRLKWPLWWVQVQLKYSHALKKYLILLTCSLADVYRVSTYFDMLQEKISCYRNDRPVQRRASVYSVFLRLFLFQRTHSK